LVILLRTPLLKSLHHVTQPPVKLLCSLQVMIAEEGSRRHGLAATALQMLMAYASQELVGETAMLLESKGFARDRRVLVFVSVLYSVVPEPPRG
jgi:hypothetical protein